LVICVQFPPSVPQFFMFFIAWAVIWQVYAPDIIIGWGEFERGRKICAIEGQVYVRN